MLTCFFGEYGYLQIISTLEIWNKWENSNSSNLKITGSFSELSVPMHVKHCMEALKKVDFQGQQTTVSFLAKQEKQCRNPDWILWLVPCLSVGSGGHAGKQAILAILDSYTYSAKHPDLGTQIDKDDVALLMRLCTGSTLKQEVRGKTSAGWEPCVHPGNSLPPLDEKPNILTQ